MTLTPRLERAGAIFLTRTMLGFVYFFAGIQRLGAGSTVGYAFAAVEITLGALLLAGLWSRPALRCLAVLIVAAAVYYGIVGLLQPGTFGPTGMDIRVVNFYLLPRAALIIVTLLLPGDDDLLSLDALADGRARQLIRS